MAKRGRPVTKSSYVRAYNQAASELEAAKKALISAERGLARAKKNHEELLADVARLDMVERSLKAQIGGTEPPQNIKYVYNFPSWTWGQTVSQSGQLVTFTNTSQSLRDAQVGGTMVVNTSGSVGVSANNNVSGCVCTVDLSTGALEYTGEDSGTDVCEEETVSSV